MSPFGRTLVVSLAAVPLIAGFVVPMSAANAAEPGTTPAPATSATTTGEATPGATTPIPADTPSPATTTPPAATPPAPVAPAPQTPQQPVEQPGTQPTEPPAAPVAPAAAPEPDPSPTTPTTVMGYAVSPQANDDSPVWARYLSMGGAASWLGAAVGTERVEADGVRVLDLQRGAIYYSKTTGPRIVTGDILTRYRQTGEFRGPLGLPTADEVAGGRGSRYSTFQNGRIYTSDAGTSEVVGPIAQKFLALGGENGVLGLPTSGDVAGGAGSRVTAFQGGRVYYHPATGANEVFGAILWRYLSLGAENGILGLPTSGEVAGAQGSRTNGFQNGRIYWSQSTGPQEIYGAILLRYASLGADTGVLGLPTSGEMAGPNGTRVSYFQNGHIYHSARGTHEVLGAILWRYMQEGGPAGRLGVPTSGEYDWAYGRQSNFVGGTITWNAFNGQTDIPLSVDPAVLARFSPQVAQWGPVVARVLADLGYDQRYVYGVLRQIRQESGGNPNAVNNNDSNWAAGYASFGLLQTIAPTYQSFAPPGQRGNVTWVTVNGRSQRFVPEMVMPYNNIYAGVNYATYRYGVGKLEAWNSGYNQAY